MDHEATAHSGRFKALNKSVISSNFACCVGMTVEKFLTVVTASKRSPMISLRPRDMKPFSASLFSPLESME